MNQVVSPLNPTMSFQQFTAAKKLVDIDPKDLVIGDVVVLVGSQNNPLQVEGEKVMWVAQKTVAEDGVKLAVLPYTPSVMQSEPVTPPYLSAYISKMALKKVRFEIIEDAVRIGDKDMSMVTMMEVLEGTPDVIAYSERKLFKSDAYGGSYIPTAIVTVSGTTMFLETSEFTIPYLRKLIEDRELYLA